MATFDEMYHEAELLYESVSSRDAPGFDEVEWGEFFTHAQHKVVLKILEEGITKNAYNQLAIEKLIKTDSYRTFVRDTHFLNSDGTLAFQVDVTTKPFSPKFFWILNEYVTTATNSSVRIKRITFDYYGLNRENPFRVPDPKFEYWMLQYDNIPIIITDGTAPASYHVVAVEHPDNYPIVSGTEYPGTGASVLHMSAHPNIVEEAVLAARMSIVDPQGYQLAQNEFK